MEETDDPARFIRRQAKRPGDKAMRRLTTMLAGAMIAAGLLVTAASAQLVPHVPVGPLPGPVVGPAIGDVGQLGRDTLGTAGDTVGRLGAGVSGLARERLGRLNA